MPGEFEIAREVELRTTPEEVWDAITTGSAGWLWPSEYEPRVGGSAGLGGTVTAWDPPHHLIGREEGEDGWFNQLENIIEARGGDTTWIRYVHSGVLADDWDNQYDGASQHTDFYLHTMAQYLQYFSRRPAQWFAADAPPASNAPDGFDRLRGVLGLTGSSAVGDPVHVDVPGVDPVDGEIDYLQTNFVGVRTPDAMYRFFGRNAFDASVGIAGHLFGEDVDAEQTEKAWQGWLDDSYA